MPTAKSMTRKHGTGKWDRAVGFADVRLSHDQKEAFVTWLDAEKRTFPSALEAVLSAGYRVTLAMDFENACIKCVWTQQDPKDVNHDLVLTSRSDEWEEAFWMNVYKVYVLYDGQRLPTQSDDRSWG